MNSTSCSMRLLFKRYFQVYVILMSEISLDSFLNLGLKTRGQNALWNKILQIGKKGYCFSGCFKPYKNAQKIP